MKNRMPSKKAQGKKSTYLGAHHGNGKSSSVSRMNSRNPNPIPHSSKVGAGHDNASISRNFIVSPRTKKKTMLKKF
ncbi:MAG: hypothetical protein JW857_11910 [Bacteroidales bacterium]|nr:hypothetical protein [Bacteroidales bacterium]MBN2747177.1 hypothetical protein [Bacteroidales bacterium]